MNTKLGRRGFSLPELLVTVGILSLLAAISLAAIQRSRNAADRVACGSNLRQIAIALHQLHDDGGPKQAGAIGWMANLLPYVEQSSLWETALRDIQIEPRTYLDPPHKANFTVIRVYTCPTDARVRIAQRDPDGFVVACSSFMGVLGGDRNSEGFCGSARMRFNAIPDGLSNTLMVGERPPPDTFLAGRWYSGAYDNTWANIGRRGPDHAMQTGYAGPFVIGGASDCSGPFHFGPGRTENSCDRMHFWSLHGGGANFAFCDSSVRFLRYSAEPIMTFLATRNDGRVVDLSDY